MLFKKSIYVLFLSLLVSALWAQDKYTTEILIHREEYKNDFLKNERAPLKSKEELAKLHFFKPNPAYKVEAKFSRTKDAKPFDLATYSGITKPYIQYGLLSFSLNGQTHKLAIYQSLNLRVMPQYRDYLFLPFKDITNGESTYGGGRYLDFTISDIKNGLLVIDFNKAYNPWCAYADGYNCPIPPKENHLPVPVNAGEKNYGEGNH